MNWAAIIVTQIVPDELEHLLGKKDKHREYSSIFKSFSDFMVKLANSKIPPRLYNLLFA